MALQIIDVYTYCGLLQNNYKKKIIKIFKMEKIGV